MTGLMSNPDALMLFGQAFGKSLNALGAGHGADLGQEFALAGLMKKNQDWQKQLPGLMQGMDPQQAAIIQALPPQVQQQILGEMAFPDATEQKRWEVNGKLVDAQGNVVYDGPEGQKDSPLYNVDGSLVDRSGNVVYRSPETGKPDPKGEGDIRKEFTSLTKDYGTISDAYTRVQAAAEDPSAAGDLALIFAYMKILDPGSVVREAEFANAQNAAGVPDQVRNMWNRALTGERLNPEQRTDFTTRAQKLYDRATGQYNKQVDQYRGLAKDYGFDPMRTIPGLPSASQPKPTGNLSNYPPDVQTWIKTQPPGTMVGGPDGGQYVWDGSDLIPQ